MTQLHQRHRHHRRDGLPSPGSGERL